MEYMQVAMRHATDNVFYITLIILFFAFSSKIGEVIQWILEESDLPTLPDDSGTDAHKQMDE